MISLTDVKKVVFSYKINLIENINKVFTANIVPEPDMVLFEVHNIGYGAYDISITPMSNGEEIGYNRIKNLLREVQFEIDLGQFLNQDNENYRQDRKELNQIAFNLIFPFFSECFDEAGQKPSCIQYYIRNHEADDVFNLQNKTWVKIEDLYK
ncbi:MAG: hypothetical protein WB502_09660 [Thermoactinomyces sp.]